MTLVLCTHQLVMLHVVLGADAVLFKTHYVVGVWPDGAFDAVSTARWSA